MATGVIYFKWHFPWDNYSSSEQLVYGYFFFLTISFSLIFSNSILVELIEQDEYGFKMSLSKAVYDSFFKNIWQIIKLALLWSLTWYFLVLLKVMFSKKKNNGTQEESAENIAKTLAGADSFSWSTFTIDMLIKALRMAMFIMIPAFAWEKKGFVDSFKRGISIVGFRTSNFIEGFIITLGVQFILYLPPSIMFIISNKTKIEFNDISWYFCIIYIGFAWSFTLYVEQLFGTELFLWQKKYENQCDIAKKNNKPLPEFSSIEKPFLLDEINDLEIIEKTSIKKENKEVFKPKTRIEKMKLNFENKTEDELKVIIENKNKYQKFAVEIAESILKNKTLGNTV